MIHAGEDWAAFAHHGRRPNRCVGFACHRPWGPDGALLAVVYETIGMRAEENVERVANLFVPNLRGVLLSDFGDPRRGVRAAWEPLVEQFGDSKRNAGSFALLHVNRERLFLARIGCCYQYAVGWHHKNRVGFARMLSAVDGRLVASISLPSPRLSMVALTTSEVPAFLPLDFQPRTLMDERDRSGTPDALLAWRRVLEEPILHVSHAAMLVDVTPFRPDSHPR